MFLIIEENDNTQSEERVFSESGPKRPVKQIQVEIPGKGLGWCDVIGVEEGKFVPAQSVQVEDSGAGTALLVFGGNWGIRMRPVETSGPWSLSDKNQWGEPFKVLDESGDDLRF